MFRECSVGDVSSTRDVSRLNTQVVCMREGTGAMVLRAHRRSPHLLSPTRGDFIGPRLEGFAPSSVPHSYNVA